MLANNALANTKTLPSRERIQELQKAMLEVRCPMPNAQHYFAPGMYGRTLMIPAGMRVVGKIHKHSHLMMVLRGKAEVVTEFDRTIVEAGHVSISRPGAKRVVTAIEDTMFMTVHHNPENTENLDTIEKDHIEKEDFKLEYHNQKIEELTS